MPTVQLTWDYVQGTAPAVKFVIERSPDGIGAWESIGEVQPVVQGSASYGYADTSIAEGESWAYRVCAVGKDGTRSTPSNTVTVDIPGVLNSPTNLQAAMLSSPMRLQGVVR